MPNTCDPETRSSALAHYVFAELGSSDPPFAARGSGHRWRALSALPGSGVSRGTPCTAQRWPPKNLSRHPPRRRRTPLYLQSSCATSANSGAQGTAAAGGGHQQFGAYWPVWRQGAPEAVRDPAQPLGKEEAAGSRMLKAGPHLFGRWAAAAPAQNLLSKRKRILRRAPALRPTDRNMRLRLDGRQRRTLLDVLGSRGTGRARRTKGRERDPGRRFDPL